MSFDIKALPFNDETVIRKYTVTTYQTVKDKGGNDVEVPERIEDMALEDLERQKVYHEGQVIEIGEKIKLIQAGIDVIKEKITLL